MERRTTMKTYWLRSGPAALLTCLLTAKAALAAPSPTEKAAAEAMFEEGTALVEQARLEEACARFTASQNLDPQLGTMLRQADCYDRVGRTASAWALFKEAGALARASGQTAREQIAEQRASDLQGRLSKVMIRVSDALQTRGLTIELNGIAIPEGSWGTPIPIDPGAQHVQAEKPGFIAWSTHFELAPEQGLHELLVPALSPAPPTPSHSSAVRPPGVQTQSAVTTPPAEFVHSSATQRLFAYVSGGLGALGLGTAGYFAYQAHSLNQDSLDFCLRDEPNACTTEGKSLRDRARGHGTIATFALAAAGAFTATGVVLYTTARDEEQPSRLPTQVTATLEMDAAALHLRGAW